ncbi:MAG: hypothetical protein SGPRY_007850, partial [Prymnesium sp.]
MKERWLGRAKHVIMRGPLVDRPAVVGHSSSLTIELEDAAPLPPTGPPSTAALLLFSKASGRELVLYSTEAQISPSAVSIQLAGIPITVAGSLTLRVTVDGADIRGSPRLLQVEPGVAHADACELALPSCETGRLNLLAGEACAFFVLLRDAHGNRTPSTTTPHPLRLLLTQRGGGGVMEASLPDGRCMGTSAQIDLGPVSAEGSVCVQLTLTLAGLYDADVWVDGRRMKEALAIEVEPGASHCARMEGEGSRTAVAGELASFIVLVHDKHGNRRSKVEAISGNASSSLKPMWAPPFSLALAPLKRSGLYWLHVHRLTPERQLECAEPLSLRVLPSFAKPRVPPAEEHAHQQVQAIAGERGEECMLVLVGLKDTCSCDPSARWKTTNTNLRVSKCPSPTLLSQGVTRKEMCLTPTTRPTMSHVSGELLLQPRDEMGAVIPLYEGGKCPSRAGRHLLWIKWRGVPTMESPIDVMVLPTRIAPEKCLLSMRADPRRPSDWFCPLDAPSPDHPAVWRRGGEGRGRGRGGRKLLPSRAEVAAGCPVRWVCRLRDELGNPVGVGEEREVSVYLLREIDGSEHRGEAAPLKGGEPSDIELSFQLMQAFAL